MFHRMALPYILSAMAFPLLDSEGRELDLGPLLIRNLCHHHYCLYHLLIVIVLIIIVVVVAVFIMSHLSEFYYSVCSR